MKSTLMYGVGGLLDEAMHIAGQVLSCQEEALKAHPDFLYLAPEENSLGVNDVEEIFSFLSNAPVKAGGKQVVIVDKMHLATIPAQNKLLKVIEEENSLLLLGLVYDGDVLETLQSRMDKRRVLPVTRECFVCDESEEMTDVLYAATRGYVHLLPVVYPVKEQFLRVSLICQNGEEAKLLPELHLLEEKDKENFYVKEKALVGALLNVMETVYMKRFVSKNDNVTYEKIKRINKAKKDMQSVSYTKDDFFALIVSLI